MKVTSFDIKNALAKKHKNEFYITECKNGPTGVVKGQLLQFDAVAIYKSWSRPQIRIYEVKMSRSDFLRDNKFHQYLPYCHEMYFVVPTGLIDRNELPTDVGLIYYNPTRKTLVTRKRAIYRNIEIDPNMLFYIFMNRIDGEKPYFGSAKKEFFERWVENKETNRMLGFTVSNKLINEVLRLQDELHDSQISDRDKRDLQGIDDLLAKHYGRTYRYDRVERLEELIKRGYSKDLDIIAGSLKDALIRIDFIKRACDIDGNAPQKKGE